MEAVPKVPMLHFDLKQTQQKSSFSRLKQYIAEYYQEDPETFSKEIYELETLRAAAYNPSIDETGYNVIKRYYCQLHSLQNRFPIENDRNLVNFVWREIYSSNTTQSSDIRHDMGIVLYNYGAIHTQLGAEASRSTEEDMKLVCTLFQRAAWAFEMVREKYQMATTSDMHPDILRFMQNICFAQAQECILEKSLIDNRKSIIVAKVASQIIEYYNSAFASLSSGDEEGMIGEIVGSKQFKEWRQYIQFKVEYMRCILSLYQGQHAEEQQKMGERVTLYQAACDRLDDARKAAKHLENMPQVNETLTFVMDVVEAKRKAAKNENEFIYHEEVPEFSSIATIAGANLVKGIPFNVADAAGDDIFHRLVPIKTHEQSSLYSEEKTNILRKITQKIEAKDNELNQFMESLNIDSLSFNAKEAKLPQSIIDRCGAMNAQPTVINDLRQNMSSLAEICVDVENSLQTIQEMLSKEELYEKDFQQTMGYRPGNHFIELNREFMRYQEAHNKAGDSNETLSKAMKMHVKNLEMLSKPLSDLQAEIPTCSLECDPRILNETQMLLNKVNEMRVQRGQLYAQLSENIQKDDITAQLVAWGENDVEKLFRNELAKHDHLINIIEQNLVAQENILKTFTDAYAKCAHFIKAVAETKHKRDIFFTSLIASYDVYDDLLGKSLKGLEFYKKLQSNIHRLCARVRSARDVHDEERQQRIDSLNKKALQSMQHPQLPPPSTTVAISTANVPVPTSNVGEYPKLSKPIDHDAIENYRNAAIRPTPIGQENTGIHDINHSTAATIPYNYNYPSTATATVPTISSNYTQSTSHASMYVPSSVPSMTSTHSSQSNVNLNQQNTYTSQTTAYYNPQLSQSNMYASAGYINPIYNNLSNAVTSPSQTKPIYSGEKSQTTVNVTSASVSSIGGAYGNVGTYSYATNPNAATSASIQPYNYNSMMTGAQNVSSQLPISSQSYLNYSQSDTTNQSNSYMNSTYSGGVQAPTTVTYHSQTPQTSIYQSANSLTNPNLSQQPQSYAGVSYTDYTTPNNQVNAYQIPANSNQYSQQQSQTQQVSQNYSHSNTSNVGHSMQVPQQVGAASTAYTNYVPGYSTQSGTLPTTNNAQSTYPTRDAYGYYNAQYPMQNTPTSSQYYGIDANNQSNQYPVSNIAPSYSTTGYGVTPNSSYSATNQTNVYNYGAVNPNAANTYSQQAQNVTPAVSHVPAQFSTPAPVTNAPVNSNVTSNVASNPTNPTTVPQTKPQPSKSNKFDLLSDLDNIPIPAPTLQPIKSTDKPSQHDSKIELNKSEESKKIADDSTPTPIVKANEEKPPVEKNDSIEKALTELSLAEETSAKSNVDTDTKFDLNSNFVELLASTSSAPIVSNTTAVTPASVPPSSANIENFYKEVQRYEKIVNGLTTKTLNGTTPLEIKWKELHDTLEKDAAKRSVSRSKLFPEKNRDMLSVPYDHSRVLLPTETDDYINAAHIRDLGSHCNHFILADAPKFNTVKDFWCMIWSQQASYVVCLSTPDESAILLFPKQLNTSQNFGDYSVTVLTEQHRLYIIERTIQVTSPESNSTRTITILQPKQWPTKNSISNLIGVSQNIVDTVTPRNMQNNPMILNCATNLERSSLVALAITCILALESEMPIIINVTDVWYRICSQRKNILTDMNILQQSMQIVLQCCREFIKKRSPKSLANNTQTNYYFIEEEEPPVKDPFKDLDPLWKLK
ncbi:tyrosine-protein phosphatase non-receptor type 23 isoform X2 [Contarinia nasturtii]|uniref:tyrosine-protein phosphatase non-receptor type 23 isoform X2 n=1 Tax=Contarinia nasturtii TaxID=265458 RepID=UPI0012D4A5B7|nr:tyrosine-protein phosphatase non-receptor type 23 isoform X2 [Contarinia nasturtii]